MSPAPIPPHERPWRHPSELAPTRADVPPERHRLALPLVAGTVTMIVVAVLVVAMTPSPSSEPIAETGTTTPARGDDPSDDSADEQGNARGASARDASFVRIAAFTPIPNAVAATPTFTVDYRNFADRLPYPDEWVLVQTESATYRIPWREVQWLQLDGIAVIADLSLDLVGYIEHDRFTPLAGR